MIRFPTITNTLRFLVAAGIDIGTVLDVGVHTGTASLQEVFAREKHILFEPVSECYETLEKNYPGIDHELVGAAVSDYNGNGALNKYSIDESGETFCQLVTDAATAAVSTVPTLRLDSFCQQRGDAKPYLLKIAVDRHELPVLRGAQAMLQDVAVLIVDGGRANLFERLDFLGPRGFRLFDMVDSTYYCGMLWRFDLIFLADGLRPPPTPVRWDQWVPVTRFDPNQSPADVDEWLPLLAMSAAGERVVRTKPAGDYRARIWRTAELPMRRAAAAEPGNTQLALLDVTSSNGTVCLAERSLYHDDLSEDEYILCFAVSEAMARADETVEVRMWTSGLITAEIFSVTVEPVVRTAGTMDTAADPLSGSS